MYIYTCTCTSIHVHVHRYMYKYMYIDTGTSTCTSIHVHVHVHRYMYMYMYIDTGTCTCTSIHVHVHVHRYRYMYMYCTHPIVELEEKVNLLCFHVYNIFQCSTGIAAIAKAQAPYGWTTFSVLHLTLCWPHAHIMDLGMKAVHIQRMWLCPVLILLEVRHVHVK